MAVCAVRDRFRHPKFVLQQLLQSRKMGPLTTRVVQESGRMTHHPTFLMGAFSGETMLGQGSGTSIRRAEAEACQDALAKHFAKEYAGM